MQPWHYVGQQDVTELPASSHAGRAKCERTNGRDTALLSCQARRNTLDFAIQFTRQLPLLNESDAVRDLYSSYCRLLQYSTDSSAHLRLGRHPML